MEWRTFNADTSCGGCAARIVAGERVGLFARGLLRRCETCASKLTGGVLEASHGGAPMSMVPVCVEAEAFGQRLNAALMRRDKAEHPTGERSFTESSYDPFDDVR